MAITKIKAVEEINFKDLPNGKIYRFWFNITTDPLGMPVQVPLIVAKGTEDGKTLGLTAAVHGNELNGIPVIQRLFKEIDVTKLKGTIVGIPAVNVVSLIRKKRRFNDGTDLNHIMPGKEDGNTSQFYAYRFFEYLVKQFDYLMDLHTASFGRVNSYYIRADMADEVVRRMAILQNAQIIVHNPPSDGTLRGAADEMGIPAITLEVGNPNLFQKGMIRSGLTGIHNLLSFLEMTDDEIDEPTEATVLCKRSYWIYTKNGGILTVFPKCTDLVEKGERIALLQNIFGDTIEEYFAPEDGIVIGKSNSPINQSGGRILHLGVVRKPHTR